MKKYFALALVALASLPALADETSTKRRGDDKANLLFVITVADEASDGATAESSMEALLLDGQHARLQAGWRIPIPTTTFNTAAASGERVPVTSFSYQDVGIELSLHARIVEDGRVRASGKVEVSSVDQTGKVSAHSPAPRVGTFSYEFDVKLTSGTEATVAEVPKPDGGSMSLSIAATIQD